MFGSLLVCALCVDWSQFKGEVRGVDLSNSEVTIQDRNGDVLTVPVDWQVEVHEKGGDIVSLNRLHLGDKIVLTKMRRPKPPEETDNLAPPEMPEPNQRGRK